MRSCLLRSSSCPSATGNGRVGGRKRKTTAITDTTPLALSGSCLTYLHVIEYGMRKSRLRFDRLLLQAFMAGVFVGMAGNACISLAGSYPLDQNDPNSVTPGMLKLLYASVFPVAFIAIITTGAELFTGNTMTMLICLFERRVTMRQLALNWVGSFVGNWLGSLFAAYFLTYLCCHFDKSPYFDFLDAVAKSKSTHGWGSCFLRGVGCNTWVCLAVWFVVACDDWAGKILALWFPIVCFVLSSYEHIIANLYTLQLCAMLGVSTPLSTMIVQNLIPTFLGNVVGGCCLVGAVYFYSFYPSSALEEQQLLLQIQKQHPHPYGSAPVGKMIYPNNKSEFPQFGVALSDDNSFFHTQQLLQQQQLLQKQQNCDNAVSLPECVVAFSPAALAAAAVANDGLGGEASHHKNLRRHTGASTAAPVAAALRDSGENSTNAALSGDPGGYHINNGDSSILATAAAAASMNGPLQPLSRHNSSGFPSTSGVSTGDGKTVSVSPAAAATASGQHPRFVEEVGTARSNTKNAAPVFPKDIDGFTDNILLMREGTPESQSQMEELWQPGTVRSSLLLSSLARNLTVETACESRSVLGVSSSKAPQK